MISKIRTQMLDLRNKLSSFFPYFVGFILIIIFTAFISFKFCRYTVREIGYSGIGSQPYLLELIVDDDVPVNYISAFKAISYATFLESNIKTKIINISEDNNFISDNNLVDINMKLPAVLFQGPDSQLINTEFDLHNKVFREEIWDLCEKVSNSNIRSQIIEKLINSFAVILFLESKDPRTNELARTEINNAQNDFRAISGLLAKPVNKPPVILSIPFQERVNENFLLWSTGMNSISETETAVIVLYGRGRIIGPVLVQDRIKARSIYNLLSIVGADCECGLDQSWMLGKMIPLIWDKTSRNIVSSELGFDLDNPLIMSEISQILSISFRNKKLEEILPDLLENNILEIERDKNQNDSSKGYGIFKYLEGKSNVEKIAFIVSFIISFSIVSVVIFIIRKRRNK